MSGKTDALEGRIDCVVIGVGGEMRGETSESRGVDWPVEAEVGAPHRMEGAEGAAGSSNGCAQ